jgi:hypothetical protein
MVPRMASEFKVVSESHEDERFTGSANFQEGRLPIDRLQLS